MHSSQITRTKIPHPTWLTNIWRREFQKISDLYVPDSVIFAIAMPFILKRLNKSDLNSLQESLFILTEYFNSLHTLDHGGINQIIVRRLITAQVLRLNPFDILINHSPFDLKTKIQESTKLAFEIISNYDNVMRKM